MIKIMTILGNVVILNDFLALQSDCDSRCVFWTSDGRLYSNDERRKYLGTWQVV